ncbi:MAG: polymer-forming cytoskeletal protein [Kangiellaceae bacterium]|jgi:cytoskeletal protein CcmA (bactofilin family)|nr:polymer-forming cytoskeletal protein [Kangiellaceae bacterium]
MFGNKSSKQKIRAKAGAADTLITQDTTVNGDIKFKGVLYVDGHIVGDIVADELEMSLLTIGKHGLVEGKVEVPHIIIHGRVDGDVYASEHIELQGSSKVEGDVFYKLIEMAMGAEVNGKLVHRDEKPKLLNHDKASQPKTASEATVADQVSDATT